MAGPTALLVIALLGQVSVEAKQCWNCGYRVTGDGEPEKLPELPFCGDFAGGTDNSADCGDSDDCCAVLKEYTIKVDEVTGENSTVVEGRHGCAQDLDHLAQYSVTCKEQGQSCFEVDLDSLEDRGNSTLTRVEICLCEAEKCNDDDPIPEVPTDGTGTTTPSGPSKTCYNCGYKCTNMVDATCTPEPIDKEGKVPFCKDMASFEDNTKQCGGGDECCGALREYFEMTNEETGKTTVDMITFHGCEKDLAGAMGSHQAVICKDHANSCYNMSKEDIVDEFVTQGSACFCDGDLCNKELPGVPFPKPPGPGPTNNPPQSKECYDCGYMCEDFGNGKCDPKPIGSDGMVHFCSDHATMSSMTKKCTGADECCGSLVEYISITNEETGKTTTNKLAFHGCEKDLAGALGAHFDVVCGGHTNACYNISREDIQDDFLTRAEACFCEGDRCNGDTPDLPDTVPTDSPPQSKECYDCGYMCQDYGNGKCDPKPIGDNGKVHFCSDHATMASMTKKCTGADECCGSLVEYLSITNSETGKVTTDKIAYHGCEKDLAEAFANNVNVVCSSHTNACYNVSREEISDDLVTRAEACFCDGDRCNDDTPDLPDTLPGGGSTLLTASLITLLGALLILN